MDWVDMVERERGREEEMLEKIRNICVCTCDICGKELHHGEEAYQISKEDRYICEDCIEPVELCADEEDILSIKYHINYDEE